MMVAQRLAAVVFWIGASSYLAVTLLLDGRPAIVHQLSLDLMLGGLSCLVLIECVRFFRHEPIECLGYRPSIGSLSYVVLGISDCIVLVFALTLFVGAVAFTGWGA